MTLNESLQSNNNEFDNLYINTRKELSTLHVKKSLEVMQGPRYALNKSEEDSCKLLLLAKGLSVNQLDYAINTINSCYVVRRREMKDNSPGTQDGTYYTEILPIIDKYGAVFFQDMKNLQYLEKSFDETKYFLSSLDLLSANEYKVGGDIAILGNSYGIFYRVKNWKEYFDKTNPEESKNITFKLLSKIFKKQSSSDTVLVPFFGDIMVPKTVNEATELIKEYDAFSTDFAIVQKNDFENIFGKNNRLYNTMKKEYGEDIRYILNFLRFMNIKTEKEYNYTTKIYGDLLSNIINNQIYLISSSKDKKYSIEDLPILDYYSMQSDVWHNILFAFDIKNKEDFDYCLGEINRRSFDDNAYYFIGDYKLDPGQTNAVKFKFYDDFYDKVKSYVGKNNPGFYYEKFVKISKLGYTGDDVLNIFGLFEDYLTTDGTNYKYEFLVETLEKKGFVELVEFLIQSRQTIQYGEKKEYINKSPEWFPTIRGILKNAYQLAEEKKLDFENLIASKNKDQINGFFGEVMAKYQSNIDYALSVEGAEKQKNQTKVFVVLPNRDLGQDPNHAFEGYKENFIKKMEDVYGEGNIEIIQDQTLDDLNKEETQDNMYNNVSNYRKENPNNNIVIAFLGHGGAGGKMDSGGGFDQKDFEKFFSWADKDPHGDKTFFILESCHSKDKNYNKYNINVASDSESNVGFSSSTSHLVNAFDTKRQNQGRKKEVIDNMVTMNSTLNNTIDQIDEIQFIQKNDTNVHQELANDCIKIVDNKVQIKYPLYVNDGGLDQKETMRIFDKENIIVKIKYQDGKIQDLGMFDENQRKDFINKINNYTNETDKNILNIKGDMDNNKKISLPEALLYRGRHYTIPQAFELVKTEQDGTKKKIIIY